HVRFKFRQHIFSEHSIRPIDRLAVLLFGRGTETRKDGRADFVRISDAFARIEVTVYNHAATFRRAMIKEQRAAGRTRPAGGEADAVRLQTVGQAFHKEQSPFGDISQLQQLSVVAGVERVVGIDGGHEHRVAYETVVTGIVSGRYRGGVYSRDGGKDRMRVHIVHAFLSQTE